jgi:hypothetical protein
VYAERYGQFRAAQRKLSPLYRAFQALSSKSS